MKVHIQKDLLVNALDKMFPIATKGLLPDYDFVGRITIEVSKTKVLFVSSNGFISASYCITDEQDSHITKDNEPGVCTVEAGKLRDSVKRIGTEQSTSLIELFSDNSFLYIRDVGSKRTKLVKLPRDTKNHNTKMQQPDGDSIFVETDHLLRGAKTVIPFQSRKGYKIEYQLVCFHWINSELRMVCGDGGCFAVFSMPRDTQSKSKREMQRLMPCEQLDVICGLVSDSSRVEMIWNKKETLWAKTNNGIELIACGIPDIEYCSYDKNAYRMDDAKACVDIKLTDMKEVVALLQALKDPSNEEHAKCHSCRFTAPSSDGNVKFEITRDQGKYECEYEVPAIYHDLGVPAFQSGYANLFFDNQVNACRHPYLRIYFIDEHGVANSRDVDLVASDGNSIPAIKDEPDGCSSIFFFASVKKEQDDE